MVMVLGEVGVLLLAGWPCGSGGRGTMTMVMVGMMMPLMMVCYKHVTHRVAQRSDEPKRAQHQSGDRASEQERETGRGSGHHHVGLCGGSVVRQASQAKQPSRMEQGEEEMVVVESKPQQTEGDLGAGTRRGLNSYTIYELVPVTVTVTVNSSSWIGGNKAMHKPAVCCVQAGCREQWVAPCCVPASPEPAISHPPPTVQHSLSRSSLSAITAKRTPDPARPVQAGGWLG